MEVTLPYLLKRGASKHPNREGIVSDAGRWTYAQWEANANKRAHALRKQGIKKGDHVATIFLNGNEVLETYFALLKLGAVIVPLNVRLSPKELQYIIEHSDATVIILSHDFESTIREIKGNLPNIKLYFMSGGEPSRDMIALEEIYQGEPEQEPSVEIREEDIAFILYTTGTTGRPKGVMLSHRNCIWGAMNFAFNADLKPWYRVLEIFPYYHAAGLVAILFGSLFVGCTNVVMRNVEPKRVMELIEEEKINRLPFSPTVWNFILQLPDLDQYDIHTVKALTSGAESMPLETKKKLLALFPNASLGESYGMTESAASLTTLNPKDILNKMASVGKPFVNVEIRLVDEYDQDVKKGEVGEILARGPSMMVGYYKDSEATSQTLKGGWLHTGDLGRMDEEDYLYIVGRKKDMIISGGENIYPREIEEILYAHPKILEAAVIGLPDSTWGERIHAVVAPKEGKQLTEQEVIDYCKVHIARFKKPKSVEFVDRLPRSQAGKVLKRILRERKLE